MNENIFEPAVESQLLEGDMQTELSELLERESRRYSRGLDEDEEAGL